MATVALFGDHIFGIDDVGILSCYSAVLQQLEWRIETKVSGAVTLAVFGNLVVFASLPDFDSLLDGSLEVIDWRKRVKLARYQISGVREMRFVGQRVWLFFDASAPSAIALELEI